jgi:hypothetical protein
MNQPRLLALRRLLVGRVAALGVIEIGWSAWRALSLDRGSVQQLGNATRLRVAQVTYGISHTFRWPAVRRVSFDIPDRTAQLELEVPLHQGRQMEFTFLPPR